MPRASSLAGLSLAAALAAAPAPARAGTFSAVDALREIPPAEKLKCPKTDADPDHPDLETLTLPQALKSLDDLLAQISTPEARKALDSSPVARDPGRASRAAVSALASKRLNAALGLLLKAHRADPRNPAHLVNLAALANYAGRHKEALALATAAEAIGKDPPAPPGANGRAILLANKGDALLHLGRTREAKAALEAATRLQSDLTGAWIDLAYALGDLDDCPLAIRTLRAAALRQPPVPPPGKDEARRIPIDQALDLSRGKAGELPALPLPRTPEEADAVLEKWFQRGQADIARGSGPAAKMDEAAQGMARRREAWKRQGASGALSAKRASLLRDAVERFTLMGPWPGGLDPVVDPLAKAYADRRKELQETSRRAYREYGKAMEQFAESQRPAALACKGDACKRVEEAVRRESCSQGRAMGDKVRSSAQAYDTAARVYFRESHRRASAAASYFSDPSYQQWVKARLEAHRLTAFGDILHTLHDDYTAPLAGVNSACKAKGTGNGPDQDQGAFPEFCELVPKGAKVKAELFVEVGVSCEEVQVGVNVGEPAGAFLEVSYGFTSGNITVFGGGQAEGSYGVGSAGTKVGGYITIDSSGNVSEVGVKSEASVSAGVAVGPASVGVEFSSEAVLINSSGTGVWQRGG